MPDVDVEQLDVPQLIEYAKSLGINPRAMNRAAIEEEIATTLNPVVPVQDDPRIATLESIISAISPVLEQLQADVKRLLFATGLTEPDKENEDAQR